MLDRKLRGGGPWDGRSLPLELGRTGILVEQGPLSHYYELDNSGDLIYQGQHPREEWIGEQVTGIVEGAEAMLQQVAALS